MPESALAAGAAPNQQATLLQVTFVTLTMALSGELIDSAAVQSLRLHWSEYMLLQTRSKLTAIPIDSQEHQAVHVDTSQVWAS